MSANYIKTGGARIRKPTALEEVAVISAKPCYYVSSIISSTHPTVVYAQLHDAAAAPSTGAVPLAWAELNPAISGFNTATGSIDFPCNLVNGAVIALSSTAASYTALGSNVALITATFS